MPPETHFAVDGVHVSPPAPRRTTPHRGGGGAPPVGDRGTGSGGGRQPPARQPPPPVHPPPRLQRQTRERGNRFVIRTLRAVEFSRPMKVGSKNPALFLC